MSTYTTRNEAIEREIIAPIEAGEATRDEFDLDAIADEVLADYGAGYVCIVEHDEFWAAVERHAYQESTEREQHFCGACWRWGCISGTHTQEEQDCSECGHELAIHLGDGCTLTFADGACNCKVRI